MPLHDLQCGAGFMLLKVLTYALDNMRACRDLADVCYAT